METLERLLDKNCKVLQSNQCKFEVIEYIKRTQSVSDKGIVFIEKLMKVAVNILDFDKDSLDGILEKVAKFGIEGIEKIEKEKGTGSANKNYLSFLQANLCSHTGEVYMFLFRKTKNIKHGKDWYNGKRASGSLTSELNPKYSSHMHSFAAKAAKALYEATGDISWAEKWYECERVSADLAAKLDPKHSSHSYGFAGDAAYELSKKTKDKLLKEEWAKIGVECYNALLDYYKTNKDESRGKLICAIERKRDYLEEFLG